MATQTTNYNLSKPEATDPFSQFRQSYNDNMDIIDANLGGGGGSGGHTIIDENDTPMTQRTGLQFTGNVSVTDDAVNDKTVVDILGGGGNIYGAFVDTSRVIASGTFASSLTYTTTEDSYAVVGIVSDSSSEAKIYIDGVIYTSLYNTGGASVYQNASVYLRKGQVMTVAEGNGAWTVSYTVYGLIQGTNGIFAPVIYSDNERVIGVWRDNKPLYQKTLIATNLNLDTIGTPLDITSLGVEMCTPIYGGSYYIVSGVKRGFAKLEYQQPNEVYLYPAINRTNTTCYVTIQYTKTTDVAGSGNWNTDGVPTVHYDTSEQVIGTWYNGKPIYQKVLTPSVNAGYNSLAHGISDLDECIKIWGTCKYNNRAEWLSLPYVSTALNYEITLGNVTASNYILEAGAGFTSFEDVRIVIEYTKTTD